MTQAIQETELAALRKAQQHLSSDKSGLTPEQKRKMRKSLEAVHSAAVNVLEGIEDLEKDMKREKDMKEKEREKNPKEKDVKKKKGTSPKTGKTDASEKRGAERKPNKHLKADATVDKESQAIIDTIDEIVGVDDPALDPRNPANTARVGMTRSEKKE